MRGNGGRHKQRELPGTMTERTCPSCGDRCRFEVPTGRPGAQEPPNVRTIDPSLGLKFNEVTSDWDYDPAGEDELRRGSQYDDLAVIDLTDIVDFEASGDDWHYSTSQAKALAARLDDIQSYADVEAWDKEAEEEVSRCRDVESKIDLASAELAQEHQKLRDSELRSAEESLRSLGFFGRLTKGKPAKTRIAEVKERLDQLSDRREQYTLIASNLRTLAEKLEAAVTFTPDSPDDYKALVKQVRQEKKDLQLEKREVNAEMREIRTDARQKAAQTYRGQRAERRIIRLRKEMELRPHESRKAALDRQILAFDKLLSWLDRFKGLKS